MRIWHKDLIQFLPKQQLIGQWKECCAIASVLDKNGCVNHLLVNKIMDYDIDHFYTFSMNLVCQEMIKRHYMPSMLTIETFMNHIRNYSQRTVFHEVEYYKLFQGWHSTRYLQQCLLNIEEKFDCGGVELEDWLKIANGVKNMSQLCEETYNNLFV